MSLESVLEEVRAERFYQDEKWGGPDNDDENNPQDWIMYIVKYLGKALIGPGADGYGIYSPTFRKNLIKVAALCVATIEAEDRRFGL